MLQTPYNSHTAPNEHHTTQWSTLDRIISRRLDLVIIELESDPTPECRFQLLRLKRALEDVVAPIEYAGHFDFGDNDSGGAA
jgi:hypothetical protein